MSGQSEMNLGLYWLFLLPINWLIVAWEYYYARRWRKPPFPPGRLETLMIAQLFSPCLFFVIYPLMPLSSESSWFLSEKAMVSAGITGVICATTTFFCFCSVIRFGEKK
jgi:hypothetical protein